jgi:hypothetical protein
VALRARRERPAGTGTRHDYIVVVLTAGKLMQETANGEIVTELALGQSYARPEGVEHNVVNSNPHEFVFVEVELK